MLAVVVNEDNAGLLSRLPTAHADKRPPSAGYPQRFSALALGGRAAMSALTVELLGMKRTNSERRSNDADDPNETPISAGLAGPLSGGLRTRCARADPFSV